MTKKQDFVKVDGTHATVTLSRPANVDGADVAVLRMREPTARDMEDFGTTTGSDATREIATFANLCEVSPDTIRALPLRDYARLQVAFGLFTD